MADAAIAALLCEGVVCPQSMGLGGGFVMTIFSKESNLVETLISRYIAPLAATEDMFVNTTVTGGKAVAVPGELMGYWELHKKYGKIKWSELFDPAIELCRNGFEVGPYFAGILKSKRDSILASSALSELFIDPKTKDVYKEGDCIKRKKLADTLDIIKNEGASSIYGESGTVGKMLVEDIQDAGGIVTVDDLMQYEVRWEKPISINLRRNRTLHTVTAPGSGGLVAFIVNVLDDFLPIEQPVISMQRITETFKFAYSKRTELGDGQFVSSVSKVLQNLTDPNYATEIRQKIDDFRTYEDHQHYGADFYSKDDFGTAHINVIAPNGDAISVTSTVNTL